MPDSPPSKMKIITEQPLNAETPEAAWLEALTPAPLFYVRNHFDIPELPADNWEMKIHGEVEQAIKISLEQIKSLPHSTQRVLLECAGNGRSTLEPPIKGTTWGFGAVAQAEFKGTSLKHVLQMVSPKQSAIEALFIGADHGKVRTGEEVPYARSMSMDEAMHEDVLLAWEMNGEALLPSHGFPLRLIVPGEYGMSSVKWLSEIQLIDKAFQGFFQVDDYVYIEAEGFEDGTPITSMRVRALIASHTDGQSINSGMTLIKGMAWGGEGAISEVQISIDGGTSWHPTRINHDPNPYAWATWSAEIEFTDNGQYELLARASDSAGNQQPLEQYWNKGGYGNNIVQRIKIQVES